MTASQRSRPALLTPVVVTSALVLAACSSSPAAPTDEAAERLTASVVRTLAHDTSSFTQGLEISGDTLIESTGRNGSSHVRISDLDTGSELRQVDLSENYFGEGMTVAGDTMWQITWRDGVAFARDPETLAERRQVTYDGEGWGICADPDTGLVMSDGSSTLTFRDPVTFEETSTTDVTLDGTPLENLNELECAEDGSVYANLWQSFDIACIDPKTGVVTAVIDARPLWDSMTSGERSGADVLNGIAQIPGTDHFLVTGKLWPTMYEVRFTTPK
ncbi:glutaminyl-peptide cyclotransferase [Rhodococcus sp. G-MC3]|uniref:glutaminyl-peptide cyclotransferase n=1 Tax=Rhodococcus sp. G-MC3 TaxID=3046209 RepID=UPI0024BB0E19|nr:glutaminyl-peptide cyclotransferase [Rhodococcus sp. G-MC3]MDJ0393802.1 glutaminyl-peptide cyclotransferase [Rhodococcus sp. G-MC3]